MRWEEEMEIKFSPVWAMIFWGLGQVGVESEGDI